MKLYGVSTREGVFAFGTEQEAEVFAHELVPCPDRPNHEHSKEVRVEFTDDVRFRDLDASVQHIYRGGRGRKWYGRATITGVSGIECGGASERYGDVFEIETR